MKQQGGVQLVVGVVLAEAAPLVDPFVQDLGLELVGGLAPAVGPLVILAGPGHVAAPIHGHPAQRLWRR